MKTITPTRILALVAACALSATLPAQPAPVPAATAGATRPKLGSTAFVWNELVARPTAVGVRRDVVNQSTPTLARFQSHITTLNPGVLSHPPHQHPLEEMILVKEGTLEVTINGEVRTASAGSVLFYAANDFHSVRNIGDKPATYIVLNFGTAATATAPAERAADSAAPGKLRSAVYEWTSLPVTPTRTGERRAVFNSPTVTCANLSCHVTTVKAGDASHGAHRHPDEEVVVVKEGTVEVVFNGSTRRGGPGSIFFFASNDEHGMRNAGDTVASYYVIRVVSEATPKPAPKK